MSFGLSELFHAKQNMDSSNTVSSDTSADRAEVSSASKFHMADGLRGVLPGQQLTGTVVSVKGQTITLRLDENQYLEAKMERGMSVALGQNMTFSIKSVSGSQISLSPLLTNTDQSSSLLKALIQAQLPVQQDTVTMVNEMMNQGMSIQKNALLSMYHQVLAYPEADPAAIVQLKQLALPVNAENLEQLELMSHQNDQITGAIDRLAEGINQLASQLAESGTNQEVLDFYQAVIRYLKNTAGIQPSDGAVLHNPKEQLQQLMDIVYSKEPGTANQEVSYTENAGDRAIPGNAEYQTDAGNAADMAHTGNAADTGNAANAGNAADIANTGNAGNAADAGNVANAAHTGNIGNTANAGNAVNIENTENTENTANTKQAENTGNSEGAVNQQHSNQAYSTELPARMVRELMRGGDLGRVFQKVFSTEWLLKPEQVADKEQVQKVYERIQEQTARLMDLLNEQGKSDSPVMKAAQTLSKNVEFMNDLSQSFAYIQLPLKMSEQKAHGDLYVYSRKKHLASEDGTVTAALHLDMDHLGMVDVYVAMTQERVRTKFYLEDQETIDFIAEHIGELDQRLKDKGYQMNSELLPRDSRSSGTILQEMLADGRNSTSAPVVAVGKQSFDVRA